MCSKPLCVRVETRFRTFPKSNHFALFLGAQSRPRPSTNDNFTPLTSCLRSMKRVRMEHENIKSVRYVRHIAEVIFFQLVYVSLILFLLSLVINTFCAPLREHFCILLAARDPPNRHLPLNSGALAETKLHPGKNKVFSFKNRDTKKQQKMTSKRPRK